MAVVMMTALTVACGKQSSSNGEAEQRDTIPAPVPVEQQYLPDTAYASVSALQFQVEKNDSSDAMLRGTELYTDSSRVLTFRKNQWRNADFAGRVTGTPSKIEVAWQFDTYMDNTPTRLGTWAGGSGWTGQPLYVHWTSDEMKHWQSTPGAMLTPDFSDQEIILGSLCGRVYFLNFETGKESRQYLDAGNPIKGTVSLDPELPLLYVGQGVPARQPFGAQVFSLDEHRRLSLFNDSRAWRSWQAFDSSPLVAGGFLFWPGENGSLYKFRRSAQGITLHSTLRYRVQGAAPGIESSISVYRNYGFFADNHGNVLAVNLNTMKPVWHYRNMDDTDGTVVCSEEDGKPYLYTACEVDKQGDPGTCRLVKLNALDGTEVWRQEINCKRKRFSEKKTLDGGMYATPLIGHGDCEGMLFANIVRNGAAQAPGEFTAFSTKDGKVIYTTPLKQFVWTSPVAFYNEKNELFVVSGDSSGNIYLIRGRTGEILFTMPVAYNFESSPCVVGNALVVGSRTNGIYKMVVK